MFVTSPYAFEVHPAPAALQPALCDAGSATQIRTVRAKCSLFCEGDEARCLYEVVSGVVRSTKLLADGRRLVVGFGYPGDLVGLTADGIYHHDCEAVGDVELNAIPLSLVDSDPALQRRVMRRAAADVAGMQDHFIMLGRKCAQEKVASFLYALLNRSGRADADCIQGDVTGAVCFDLPMSRSDIADFLGLTIETVSRTFTKLKLAGVIALPQPHRVCVANPERLQEIAERDE